MLSMAALLLQNEICQISIVDAMVAKSITRELRRTIAGRRRIGGWPVRIATREKTVRPEAAKRERRVETMTEMMRHKLLVRLVRQSKRTPVTVYRTIAATSPCTSVVALL